MKAVLKEHRQKNHPVKNELDNLIALLESDNINISKKQTVNILKGISSELVDEVPVYKFE